MALARVNTGDLVAAANVDQFIDLLTGVMTDQGVTLKDGLSVYVGTSTGTGGFFQFLSNGTLTNDGGYLEYFPASAGNTANRVNITGASAGSLDELDLYSKAVVLGALTTVGRTGLMVRGDNSAVDPGMPWVHSDGSALIINPHGTGDLYLAWDAGARTHVGQALTVTTTLNLGGGTDFIIDYGQLLHTYGGGTDNFTITMNKNFSGRTPFVVMMSQDPTKIWQLGGKANASNQIAATVNGGVTGNSATLTWIAIG